MNSEVICWQFFSSLPSRWYNLNIYHSWRKCFQSHVGRVKLLLDRKLSKFTKHSIVVSSTKDHPSFIISTIITITINMQRYENHSEEREWEEGIGATQQFMPKIESCACLVRHVMMERTVGPLVSRLSTLAVTPFIGLRACLRHVSIHLCVRTVCRPIDCRWQNSLSFECVTSKNWQSQYIRSLI